MPNVHRAPFPTIRTPQHIVQLMRIEEEMNQLRQIVLQQDKVIQVLEAQVRALTYGGGE